MPAPIIPLIEAVALWRPRGALIGIDLGTKTIGIAVSDPDRKLAAGVETIARKNFTADAKRPTSSCSGCRSIWTAVKARARNPPALSRAISPS